MVVQTVFPRTSGWHSRLRGDSGCVWAEGTGLGGQLLCMGRGDRARGTAAVYGLRGRAAGR